MVLDDQIFSMSVMTQHRLELRREILISDRVDDDTRVLFHLLNCGLLDQEVMDVRIMPSHPSFSSISLIYCKTSCPKHNVKLHNYALTITTTTRGTCLWSRYPVLVIIRELEDSTSRPSVAS